MHVRKEESRGIARRDACNNGRGIFFLSSRRRSGCVGGISSADGVSYSARSSVVDDDGVK
jgi:hypothetical protein